MKNLINTLGIIFIIFASSSCENKPEPPVLSTNSISEITTTSAVSGGNVTDDGGATIISRGVCWDTSDKPDISNNKTSDSGGSGSFTSNLTLLTPNTSYYVRAYATNSAGTSYGASVSFKTIGDKPASTAANASAILTTTATLKGTVNPNSLSTIVTFEYGLTSSYGSISAASQSPLTGDTNEIVTTGLNGLEPGKTYHFRLKAENSLGIVYSDDMTFTTLGQLPTVTTLTAINIQSNGAALNAEVNPNYLSTTIVFEWGTSSTYGNSIIYTQNPLTGSASMLLGTVLTGLTPCTTYHYRVRGENSIGISVGSDMTFKTLGGAPIVTTQAANNLQTVSATINGTMNPNYFNTAVSFEWGTTIDYGNTIIIAQSPYNGATTINISAGLSGLAACTTYHFRIRGENNIGITVGNDMTFKTLGGAPITVIPTVSNLQMTTATLKGFVNPNYFITNVSFEYGTTLSYGSIVNVSQGSLIGSTSTPISADISGLTQGTVYHIRIKATNDLGATLSDDITFTTLAPISDYEGNTYNIRTIENLVWMTENLKATKYNDGSNIPTITDNTEWASATTPAYCWYNNDIINKSTYGALYNWYSVNTMKLCPSGWHVPSDVEFTALTNYLGGANIAGGKLKETGFIHWSAPNTGATNTENFSALPAGVRGNTGVFSSLGYLTEYWTSSKYDAYTSWNRQIGFNQSLVHSTTNSPMSGNSVRCVKD